jgi:hypothetical protein
MQPEVAGKKPKGTRAEVAGVLSCDLLCKTVCTQLPGMSRDKHRASVAGAADLAHRGALLQSPVSKAALVHLGHAACRERKGKAAKKLAKTPLKAISSCCSRPQDLGHPLWQELHTTVPRPIGDPVPVPVLRCTATDTPTLPG